jgi:type II restriction enzyme
MNKDFNLFMSQLQETNQTLDFFCDFDKISANVAEVEISLNSLNYLIGKENLEKAVEELWLRDPSAFEVLGILIAVREGNKPIVDKNGNIVLLKSYFESKKKVVEFLKGTGLSEIFESSRIKNLVDYVFGIETGLDTNARKNRSGHIMENTVARLFRMNNIRFRQEVYSSEFPEISSALGTDQKRFDFYIKTADKKYLIEVNFYSGGGSKLNEVARAYTELAPKVNSVKGFEFVWITDGIGWKSARNKLEEAYNTIPNVYNLTSIESFVKLLK